MRLIHAFGVIQDILEPLDVVEMLRSIIPPSCKIQVISDLEIAELQTPFCWQFGSNYDEEAPSLWLEDMKKSGYVFEEATLYIDEKSLVAGLWPNEQKKEEEQSEEEQLGEVEQALKGSSEVAEGEETKVEAIDEMQIAASVILTGTTEEGKVTKFKIRGKYKKQRSVLADTIAIDRDNDFNKEDLQKVLDWVNECNLDLIDYTLEGPAYCASQSHVHNFSLARIVLDQMHAAVLQELVNRLQKTLDAIKLPVSATEMKIDGK